MMHLLRTRRYSKSLLVLIIFYIALQFCAISTRYFNYTEQQQNSTSVAPGFAKRQVKLPRSKVQNDLDNLISVIFKHLFNVLSLRIFTREDDYYTLHSHEVTNVNFPLVDNGSHVCSELTVAPIAVLLILSTWEYRAKRDAIRRTWLSGDYSCKVPKISNVNDSQAFVGGAEGRTWPHVVRHVFLFGVPENETRRKSVLAALDRESQEHHDIVIADFWDTHSNLTLKVLSGLRWATKFCPEAQYVIKTDHDVFIHVPRLIGTILRPENQNAILGGYSGGQGDTVYRDGRYRIPYEAYPFDYGFPEHVKGGVYSMNLDIARSILQVAPFMPYIGVEDLHITGVSGYSYVGSIGRLVSQHHRQMAILTSWLSMYLKMEVNNIVPGILRRVAGVQVKGFETGMYRDWVKHIPKEIRRYLNGNRIASHLARGHSALRILWQSIEMNSVC